MKKLLYLFSCCLMALLVACGGTTYTYWTYTAVDTPTHINHPTYIPVWVDSTFDARQVEEIKAAIAEWNYVLNGQIVIQLQTRKELGTDKVMRDYPITFSTWEEGQGWLRSCEKTGLGWIIFNVPSNSSHLSKGANQNMIAYVTGHDEHFVIVITDRVGMRSLKDIMMHEFAHLLGAEHVNAPSLEYPAYGPNEYTCIDKITVAQVASERSLNFNSLNYCVTPHFE